MITLELISKEDRTEEAYVLNHRFTNEVKLAKYIALSNITLWHNWKNITSKRKNNWFYLFIFESDLVDESGSNSIVNVKQRLRQNFVSNEDIDLSRIQSFPDIEKKFIFAHHNNDYDWFEENGIIIPDGSYSIEDLNNFIHLHLNLKQGRTEIDRDFGINLYANPTYNRVSVQVDDEYILVMSEGLAETLGSESQIVFDTEKNFENPPKIETVEKILVHCDLVKNDFQPENRNLLFTFTPNELIGRLISPQIYFPVFKESRSANVRDVKVWLTNQNNEPLVFEDSWSVTLILKDNI